MEINPLLPGDASSKHLIPSNPQATNTSATPANGKLEAPGSGTPTAVVAKAMAPAPRASTCDSDTGPYTLTDMTPEEEAEEIANCCLKESSRKVFAQYAAAESMGDSFEQEFPLLTAVQTRAVWALADGKSFGEVAAEVKTSRTTLYRWREHNVPFKAALEWVQKGRRHEVHDRMKSLAASALDNVEKALARQDHRLSMQVLKELRLIDEKGLRKTPK